MEQSPSYQFKIHTFGCKVNTYDTGLLQKRLTAANAGAAVNDRRPLVHILNSCAVTAEATKDAIKEARRLKAKEPLATVVMTGCAAQVDGAMMDHLPGIDLIVANSHKGQLESILDRYFRGDRTERVFRSNIFRKDDLEAGGGQESAHTRAFLKIQDGCNSFCTYCVIPFARGKSRSLGVKDLIARINELVAKGTREIVLTGVHIGDYEDRSADARIHTGGEPALLHNLIAAVLKNTKAERIRLSSLEPVELTPQLLELYKTEPRLCRHFHMSIQSANTRVLAGMKRNYTSDDIERALTLIATELPGSFVGMDVIAGFTGETDEEFEDTYLRLARLPWTRLHVFPYSERPGTKAALMENPVPRERRVLRAGRLRELSSERFREQATQQIGSEKTVLLLKDGTSSLSRDYWPVRLQTEHALERLVGEEVRVRITGFDQTNESRMDGNSPRGARRMSESQNNAQMLSKLNYTFKRAELLEQALTHKSFRHENSSQGSDNEKLEFLGDAVLDLALSEILMSDFSNDNEGSLSKKRASLVNEESLAALAREMGIDSILRMGKGERLTGGDKKPRLLASSLEAIIGAVFLDGGYPVAFDVVRSLFSERVKEIATTLDFATDFKTRLQEVSQELHRTAPQYRVVSESGPDHDKIFEVAVTVGPAELAQGQGRSKKAAEQEAARKALDAMAAQQASSSSQSQESK